MGDPKKSKSAEDNGTVSKGRDQFQEDSKWEEWVNKIMDEMDQKYQSKAKQKKYLIRK